MTATLLKHVAVKTIAWTWYKSIVKCYTGIKFGIVECHNDVDLEVAIYYIWSQLGCVHYLATIRYDKIRYEIRSGWWKIDFL